jgi:SAM-dependent methyltransferase
VADEILQYRKKIYERYVSLLKTEVRDFDEAESIAWGVPYERYLRGWLPNHKEGFIIDIACGSGKLLHFFQRQGFKNIQGIDISPEQVAIARQFVDNVQEGDVLAFLGEYENHFDLITGIDIVEHLKKDEVCRFFEICHKALKKGGRLILQTPNADSPWSMSYRYGDFTHENCFNIASLSQLFNLYGFKGISGREAGPVVHGVFSFFRFIMWRVVWVILALWNMIETGDIRSGIYTRVFLISAIKP